MTKISKLLSPGLLLVATLGAPNAHAATLEEAFQAVVDAILFVNDRATFNKGLIDDNDSRITDLENAPAPAPDFSGYDMPFAADGAPRNVVVFTTQQLDGSINFQARVRYANSTEIVMVDGVATTPPFIVNYVSAFVDPDGNLQSANSYIEAPATDQYLDYTAEAAFYSLPALVKTVTQDNRRETWVCGDTSGAINTCQTNAFISGVQTESFTPVRVKNLLGAGEINGMQFDELRGDQRTYTSSLRYEVKAKGIGMVMRLPTNQPPQKAIYYRIDGATDGSLAGTPFDTGALLDGLFF